MNSPTDPSPAGGPPPAATPAPIGPDAPCVLAVELDGPTHGLLAEWLADAGCRLVDARSADDDERANAVLVIVDLPYPRESGIARAQQVCCEHPGTPVLAMSPTFFASVQCCGAVARSLGVAGVLPKPVTREGLIAAVRRVLRVPAA